MAVNPYFSQGVDEANAKSSAVKLTDKFIISKINETHQMKSSRLHEFRLRER